MTGCKSGTDNKALGRVMDLLMDISSHLEAMEHGMEELRTARPEASERTQSISTTQPTAQQAEDAAITVLSVMPLLHLLWWSWLNP